MGAVCAATCFGSAPARAADANGTSATSSPASDGSSGEAAPRAIVAGVTTETARPPPLHIEYAQYGAALTAELSASAGKVCPEGNSPAQSGAQKVPCIVGSGGGLAIRVGYRPPGPWYFGGAYEFVKMDSSNLYRLGIFQQLRAEMRFIPDVGRRAAPYATWGIGAVSYGNEWGVQTGGGELFGGVGLEFEVSRTAVLGLSFVYRPVLLAGWTDTANYRRETGIAQFFGLDFLLEIRSALGRR